MFIVASSYIEIKRCYTLALVKISRKIFVNFVNLKLKKECLYMLHVDFVFLFIKNLTDDPI